MLGSVIADDLGMNRDNALTAIESRAVNGHIAVVVAWSVGQEYHSHCDNGIAGHHNGHAKRLVLFLHER